MAKGWLKYTTQDMHELAQTKGFSFLSEKYEGIQIKHLWECDKSGCPQCAGNRKYTLEEIKEIFLQNNVTLLSKNYISMNVKHWVQCNKCKSKWQAKPSQIKNGGQKCLSCKKGKEVR